MKKKAYEIVDSVKQLEKAISRVKEAQRRFSQFSQEQVDRIFLAAATAANKARIGQPGPRSPGQAGRGGNRHGRGGGQGDQEPLRFRVYIQHLPRYKDLRCHRRGQGLRHKEDSRAHWCHRSCHTYNQPHIYGYIQGSYRTEDTQRHHHQPSPESKAVHNCRSKGSA